MIVSNHTIFIKFPSRGNQLCYMYILYKPLIKRCSQSKAANQTARNNSENVLHNVFSWKIDGNQTNEVNASELL